MRIIPALVAAFVALAAQASVAAGAVGEGRVGAPAQHRCRLLPKSQQPPSPKDATGAIVVTIPATTCNTPVRRETGASQGVQRR